jgi:hypothetical protein
MKKLLVLVAFGTVLAAPAFAQRDPNDPNVHHRARAAQRSTIPPGGIYYERNNNLNPDFQLGSERWKTNKLKPAPHHGSVSPKRAKAESQPRQLRTTVE